MISLIIRDVVDPYFQNLEFLEHYGGFTVPKRLQGLNETQQKFEEIFPFSCDTAVDECTRDQQFLVPNKNKLSIGYWEELGEANINDTTDFIPGDKALHFSQEMRFVYWFNFGRMGYESPTEIKSAIQGYLLNLLDGLTERNTIDPKIKLIRLEVEADGVSEEGDRDVFSKYSYFPNYEQLFEKPYDFFALDFTFEWLIWRKCIPAIDIKASVVC